jgi:hypothetical protein
MSTLNDKVIRTVVKAQLGARFEDKQANKQLAHEILLYITGTRNEGAKTRSGITQLIAKEYGVLPEVRQAGRSIYYAIFEEED